MKKYIVTRDTPFYPAVEYVDTMQEAERLRDEWVTENHSENGRYKCHVVIAEVVSSSAIQSDY